MAEVVLGAACSHSPQLSIPADQWVLRADYDRSLELLGVDGKFYSYDQLEASASPDIEKQLVPELRQARFDACQRGIARLGELLRQREVDVLVVVGDDHHELFKDDCLPSFAVFTGDRAWCIPAPEGTLHVSAEITRASNFGDKDEAYPCIPELALAIVGGLTEAGFDVARFDRQIERRPIGHAYTFTYRRLMKPGGVGFMQPITFNTYFPPNQMPPHRSWEFGKALRSAIEAWDGDKRVGIMASGGLSHFVVDEELDEMVLRALKDKDLDAIAALPRDRLNSGNSEARNWIAVAGAMHDRQMELIDYVPCYRSMAGTGCAMGFAYWN